MRHQQQLHGRATDADPGVAGVDASQKLPTGAWEAQLLNVEEATYVGPDLVPLLGAIALANDSAGAHESTPSTTTYSTTVPSYDPQAPSADLATHMPVEARRAVTDLHCATCDVWVEESTPADRGYNARPKKGKPLPRAPIRRRIEGQCGWRIVVTGPDFVGCTTLLRGLERVGHRICLLAQKPTAARRDAWHASYFEALVDAWVNLPMGGPATFTDDSPWAYLTKHACHLTPAERSTCHTTLAPLALPNLTIALHTSGRAVGLRNPHYRHAPDEYSP